MSILVKIKFEIPSNTNYKSPSQHTEAILSALSHKARMTTIASLLAEPKSESWALSTCEFLQAVTDSSLEDAAFRAQVCHLLKAAYDDADFVHCYLSVGQYVEEMLEDTRPAPRPPTPRPAEPVILASAPVAAAPRLPAPMTAVLRRSILGIYEKEPKPTFHGCGYFDGAPWDICYACEYEKDPSNYERKMRHSDLVQLISAYFRDAQKGSLIKGWSNETLEDVVAFLDTPREHRSYTDEQISRGTGPNTSLLAALRELMR